MSNERRLKWLQGFLEMIEAGDAIIGSTAKSLALRAQLKAEIAGLEVAR